MSIFDPIEAETFATDDDGNYITQVTASGPLFTGPEARAMFSDTQMRGKLNGLRVSILLSSYGWEDGTLIVQRGSASSPGRVTLYYPGDCPDARALFNSSTGEFVSGCDPEAIIFRA